MINIQEIKNKWLTENTTIDSAASENEILLFQDNNGVKIPHDLELYFKSLNGTGEEYTDNHFQFYSISRIRNVKQEFEDWNGIPDYKALSLTLNHPDKIFVFANFQFNLMVYAIELHPDFLSENSIYVACGTNYKKIASSFSDFILLYLEDSIELYFNA